jgi:hypothetical protein
MSKAVGTYRTTISVAVSVLVSMALTVTLALAPPNLHDFALKLSCAILLAFFKVASLSHFVHVFFVIFEQRFKSGPSSLVRCLLLVMPRSVNISINLRLRWR